MKATEFSPGDYCRFPNSEIPAMLDLLRENGYPVWIVQEEAFTELDNAVMLDPHDNSFKSFNTNKAYQNRGKTELSRSEFLYKATRGNVKPEVEFDGSKQFEVSLDDNCEHYGTYFATHGHVVGYVGETSKGIPVVEFTEKISEVTDIRNIQPFNASMLEVGEYMECETGQDGKKSILKRISNEKWICIRHGIDTIDAFTAKQIKGRRVDVELIVKEV